MTCVGNPESRSPRGILASKRADRPEAFAPSAIVQEMMGPRDGDQPVGQKCFQVEITDLLNPLAC